MANELMIQKRMKVIEAKMEEIIRDISWKYEKGEIESVEELQHLIYTSLNKFYRSIGYPTLEVIKAWGPPYSEHHENMMKQIYTDLATLYDEVNYMVDDIKGNFEQIELERQSFHKRIHAIESKVKGVDLNLKESYGRIIFRDDFIDVNYIDDKSIEGSKAHISANEGLMTLSVIDNKIFNEYASITITKGNGLPGNTHLVRSTGDRLKFDGEDGLHINLATILDQNRDTWFEYEFFKISDQVFLDTQGLGFNFKEGKRWATQYIDDLRLQFTISLPKGREMNWFSLTPFIPYDKGALPCLIEKIVVSDEQGSVHEIGEMTTFNGVKGFLFPKIKCKTIHVHLYQPNSYNTEVGHFFFKQASTNVLSALDKKKDFDGIIMSGVYPSIQHLDVTYDTGKQDIIYPDRIYGEEVPEDRNALFQPVKMGENIYSGIERVKAKRFAIGIRDVSIANYQYESKSEYISKPFYSEEAIHEVSLNVDYEIPSVFPEDEEWIEFYFTINGGQEWHRIHEENIYHEKVITKYLFNSSTPKESRLEEIGYIDDLSDIHEVQLKIVLKRPTEIEDAVYYTPIVYGYKLNITTKGEKLS